LDRRAFLSTLAGTLLAAPLPAVAQPERKAAKVGLITVGAPEAPWRPAAPGVFWDRLRELGWVEGENLTVERRGASGDWSRVPTLAAELARANVAVILANTGGEARRAHEGTRSVPICALAGDLQADGLVVNLAKPEGNVTGVQIVQADLPGKRLALLKETTPKLTRVGLLLEGRSPTFLKLIHAAQKSARTLRLQLSIHVVDLSRPESLAEAFSSLTKARVRGLIVVNGPGMGVRMDQVVGLAAESRIVAIYDLRPWVESGGLMSYGPIPSEFARSLAECVDKIIRGAKPADVPVQQPTKFELLVNLKTAKALGLGIPPSLLARADQVIE
jgi:putative tryptophan/tyrosine transport system substrate-binding protein